MTVLKLLTRKLADQFLDKKSIAFVLQIFAHNLITTYLTICLVVLFGIIPAYIAVFNGLITGRVIAKVLGVSGSEIAVILIPYGIFELPAMMIAWGIGIRNSLIKPYKSGIKI
jgi:stage II sporulation protein M